MTQGGGTGGKSASIFITGLSESDTVTAVKDGKTVPGKCVTTEKEVATQVPAMTSNTTPYGIASAKSMYDASDCAAYFAFTGKPVANYQAHSISGDSTGWWVAYDFGYAVTIDSFEIAPQFKPDGGTLWYRFPHTFTLQGSNDGEVWDDIEDFSVPDSLLNITTNFQILSYKVAEPKTYSRFRVVWGDMTDNYASCSYVQFYGTAVKAVSGHEITIKEYGMYTVTATNGEKTTTQDVLVDAAVEYEIDLRYGLMIYNNGTIDVDLTHVTSGNKLSATLQEDHILYSCNFDTANEKSLTGYRTTNKVDVSDYSKFKIKIYVDAAYNDYLHFSYGLVSNASPTYDNYTSGSHVAQIGYGATNYIGKFTVLEFDINDLSGEFYPSVGLVCWTDKAIETVRVYEWWLE